MLNASRLITTLPVTDLKRARQFYTNVLGLVEWAVGYDGSVMYRFGDGGFVELVHHLMPTKAEHTLVSFEVQDLEPLVHELQKRGVEFGDYDPRVKTHEKIARENGDRGAWFRDTEGNLLCVHQRGAH